jgi:hypothetical protein
MWGGSKPVPHGDKGVGQGGHLPAVRTVFLMDSIIRLSPEACKRTLVRSSGLGHRQGQGAAARSRGYLDGEECVLGYRCGNRCGDTY